MRAVHIDVTKTMNILIEDRDLCGRLNNLKRIGHIRDPGHTDHLAIRFRVRGQAVPEILLPLRGGPRLVRNSIANDDALPGGDSQSARMIFNVPHGRVYGLPDALKIRISVGSSRRRIRLLCRLLSLTGNGKKHQQRGGGDERYDNFHRSASNASRASAALMPG